ncbi:hypothetical protein ACR8AL_14600 [Clavibacter sepedonicus]|uniref:Membrane protein n=1 Tax=Clavibacter sepedonicus TaxID=31964 RepID=B0RJ81_CLASE|nr:MULTISPECIES: hypothetical protein [Clavibacter]MBD5382570.1 hypothetical protein [Clavibacter sp.]OQJ45220.1 hypothetical protein B5P19_15245 [Clavibacter sepedonicus]OQJ50855.1 hypothetical protein B5P20_15580 [Clavibacter sepedonicus]UUK67346.1 hypothetical protein LRE50_16435 [Clavibacter sepedonicus]CAQ03271.1 putative membrane protein [Clavibacter sepedonicus]
MPYANPIASVLVIAGSVLFLVSVVLLMRTDLARARSTAEIKRIIRMLGVVLLGLGFNLTARVINSDGWVGLAINAVFGGAAVVAVAWGGRRAIRAAQLREANDRDGTPAARPER